MESLPRVPSSSTGQAVFNCYDQLRREIQALLAENEALKRVVDLIKENQQLRGVIRSRPDVAPHLLPIFLPTPRADGGPADFFSTANASAWGSDPTEREVSISPAAAQPGGSSLDSQLSSSPLFPLGRRRTFAGHFQDSPGRENHLQRLSCPLDRFSPGVLPADAPLPPAQPLPELPRDPQASGTRFPFPTSPEPRALEQPPPEQQSLLPQSPGPMSSIPLSPIPLPPAQVPPEQSLPPELRLPEQLTPVRRSPDVRPKEHLQKIARAVDRPASVRESPRPGSHRDAKQQTRERIVGEIAFQLDRRILASVFPERVRLYGFTVSNIPEKIMTSVFDNSQAGFDERYCAAATRRYVTLMNRLKALGYSPDVHPSFSESVVNAYGILRERPEPTGPDARSYGSPGFLRRVVLETVPAATQPDVLLLLECLQELARDDGKPLFVW
ncbi:speriolin [Apteryx mantelli]|uniref:Speriolin n=1 Tax=Apteryx mantelli TaxID=2696672 RepID=A0ABM4E7H3_9AVES